MEINNKPTVSVIIPVFNGSQFIKEAVESVFNQSFKDFEIIIVDDGSTDDTKNILDPWIKEERLKYVYQQNKGLAGARNTGIRVAKGEFLKFLDCDDLLYPRQLEYQVSQLKDKSELTISVTDYELEFESKTRKRVRIRLGTSSQLAQFIKGNPCPSNVILVRRSIIEQQGGFDEQLYSHEDTDLWLRILIHGGIFEKVDYVGCCYRIFKNSLSGDNFKMHVNYCKVLEKLNKALLPELHNLHEKVIQRLLLTNTKLICQCFALKIKPESYLPITLEASSTLYLMQTDVFRRSLLKILGIRKIIFLIYLKNCLTKIHYRSRLINTAWWRDERNYVWEDQN